MFHLPKNRCNFIVIIILLINEKVAFLTGHELIQKSGLNLALLLPFGVLGGGLLGPLLVDDGLLGVRKLSSLLASKGQSIVGLIPKMMQLRSRALNIKGRVVFDNN